MALNKIGEYGFEVKSGHWLPDKNFLRVIGALSDNVGFEPPKGRVVHVNSSLEFEMGASGRQLPMLIWNSVTDPSVRIPSHSAKGGYMATAAIPRSKLTAMPMNVACEVETTEFDTEQDYVSNELLTTTADNDDITVGGVITNVGTGAGGTVEQYTDLVCGIVYKGKQNNARKVSVLNFWTYFLPAAA